MVLGAGDEWHQSMCYVLDPFNGSGWTITCSASDAAGQRVELRALQCDYAFLEGAADTTLPVVTVPSNQNFSTTNSTGVMYYHDQNGSPIIMATDDVGFAKMNWQTSTPTEIGPANGNNWYDYDLNTPILSCSKTGAVTMTNWGMTYDFHHYPVGTTTVTCTATDAAGNVGTASFTVTVNYTAADTNSANSYHNW